MQAVIAIAVVTALAWWFLGPEPRLALRARQRRVGADHRLPLRGRPRNADLDHRGDGPGALNGILFRNAEAVEKLREVDTLVVDKTGTLTVGQPELVDFVVDGIDEREALRLIASLERASEHPLAQAIVAGRESRKLRCSRSKTFARSPARRSRASSPAASRRRQRARDGASQGVRTALAGARRRLARAGQGA